MQIIDTLPVIAQFSGMQLDMLNSTHVTVLSATMRTEPHGSPLTFSDTLLFCIPDTQAPSTSPGDSTSPPGLSQGSEGTASDTSGSAAPASVPVAPAAVPAVPAVAGVVTEQEALYDKLVTYGQQAAVVAGSGLEQNTKTMIVDGATPPMPACHDAACHDAVVVRALNVHERSRIVLSRVGYRSLQVNTSLLVSQHRKLYSFARISWSFCAQSTLCLCVGRSAPYGRCDRIFMHERKTIVGP